MSQQLPIVPAVSVGDLIAETYRVEELLGAGGMGVVVAARHVRLDDEVAIKIMSPEVVKDPQATRRFDREARASAKIKSDHVVRVFDIGRLANGVPYMVMERLIGRDLAALLGEQPQLPIERAADFGVQICAALADAHRLGIVHRDIKPPNVFCQERPDGSVTIKVLDFGISKLGPLLSSFDERLTRTSTVIGSPSYMSPEQMRAAHQVDPLTDIWSLGVVLYEAVTGKLPFRGTSYPEICVQVVSEDPQPPSVHRPDVPEAFEAIIVKCLQKDPGKRYQTVSELADALAPFAPGHSRHSVERIARSAAASEASSPPPSTLPAPGSVSSNWVQSTWARTVHPLLHGRRARWIVGGVASALVLGLVLVLVVGLRETPPPAQARSVATATRQPEIVPRAVTAPQRQTEVHSALPALPAPNPSGSSIAESDPPSPSEPSRSEARPVPVRATARPLPAGTPVGSTVTREPAAARPKRTLPRRTKNQVWTQRD